MTRLDRVQDSVRRYGIRGPNHNGDYSTCCPFCPARIGKDDTSFKLQLNPQVFSKASKQVGSWFYCYRCEARGSIDLSWLDLPEYDAVETDEPKEWQSPPEGFEKLDTSTPHRTYVDYLSKRGVLTQAKAVGVGCCRVGKYRGRVVVPMMARGAWVGFSARTVIPSWKDAPKYLYPKGMDRRTSLWGLDWVPRIDKTEPLYLVEGVFDALPLYPYGLASFGKNVTDDQLAILAGLRRRIIVCLDGDAWYDARAVSARLRMRGVESTYCHLPPGKDPGTLGWRVKEFVC